MTLHEKVVLSAYTGILMCDFSEFAIVSDAATGVTILIAGIPLIFPMHSMLQPSPTALRR